MKILPKEIAESFRTKYHIIIRNLSRYNILNPDDKIDAIELFRNIHYTLVFMYYASKEDFDKGVNTLIFNISEHSDISKYIKDNLLDMMKTKKIMQGKFIGAEKSFMTFHEFIVFCRYGNITPHVVFGTGKGGLKNYGSKKFVADFVITNDETGEQGILEIDGSTHSHRYRKIMDYFKTLFFKTELNMSVQRITNEDVENMLLEDVKEDEKRYLEVINSRSNIWKVIDDLFQSNILDDIIPNR